MDTKTLPAMEPELETARAKVTAAEEETVRTYEAYRDYRNSGNDVDDAALAAYWEAYLAAVDAEVAAQNEYKTLRKNTSPAIGMGATIQLYTDRHAATVVAISPSGHQVTIQEDEARLNGGSFMSEKQDYEYTRNERGTVHTCTRRKNGSYQLAGSSEYVYFGFRANYRDPHF